MATTTADIALSPSERRKRDRLVIIASSLGTMFEWYDFFIYGTLAALLGAKFFPVDNPTAQFLASLAAFGAGFAVRPLGAVVFGHLGDLIGRKYTFLVTILLMGIATAAVGALPTYANIGLAATALLVVLRLLQGLALGGEYGGAAIYVAEHAPDNKRGLYTSWIQASVVGGFVMSLLVVFACKASMSEESFLQWGWRLPFLLSLVMLGISLYVRVKLKESPVFAKMKAEGKTSKNPLFDSFRDRANIGNILVALFGVAAGLTVIAYTALFSPLYFLERIAGLSSNMVYWLSGAALVIAAPFYILSGALSDRIGRKKVIVVGYLLTLATLHPTFHMMAKFANPELATAMETVPVTVHSAPCDYDAFAGTQTAPCAQAYDFFTKKGISYEKAAPLEGGDVVMTVGGERVTSFDEAAYNAALATAGYPAPGTGTLNAPGVVAMVVWLAILSALTYGPVAATLVELFPAKVRYTSLSTPYHIGTGYFGGFLPLISNWIAASVGNVYAGLWYTWGVVLMALIVSMLFLPETKDRDLRL